MNLKDINKPTEYDIPSRSQHHDEIVEWIKSNLIQLKRIRDWHTSYGLKSYAEQDLDIYIKNGEMKYALQEAGFKAYHTDNKNWNYAISRKSPALQKR